jgi:hypothetical protein
MNKNTLICLVDFLKVEQGGSEFCVIVNKNTVFRKIIKIPSRRTFEIPVDKDLQSGIKSVIEFVLDKDKNIDKKITNCDGSMRFLIIGWI